MSNRVEWAEAGYVKNTAEILEHDEAVDLLHPDVDEEVAEFVLCLDSGGSTFAIEGTAAALLAFGERVVFLAQEVGA